MKAALDANEIASYLRSHPEFFDNYADLLSQVLTPDPHNGRAVSITERQIGALRDKNRQLEAKLAELIHFGEENDAISEKVHHLALALIAARDLPAVLDVAYSHLGGALAVPNVALRLWGITPPAMVDEEGKRLELVEFSPVSDAAMAFAATLKQPYCGTGSGLDVPAWFGERGAHVRSMALMPLKSADSDPIRVIGMLALGSEEAHRFYAEMGTLFLSYIANMIETALLRVQD